MTKELNKILKKLESGRTYRKMNSIHLRALQDGEPDDGFDVEGYATTFNEPYNLYRDVFCNGETYIINEQVDPHAFDECDMSDVIMQYDHEGRVFARLTNNTLALEIDNHGLNTKAKLRGTTIGKQLLEEIDGGYTTKMSFGFTITEDKKEVTEDMENHTTTILRTITKIGKLYDVSAVSLPANDATEISARNFYDGVIKEIQTERSAKRAEYELARSKALALLNL